MQSPASIGRALYRITFKGGSPERIHYSQTLTIGALLALVVLAGTIQWLLFGGDAVKVVLYTFTWIVGLYLFLAYESRKAPPVRLRRSLQAALLVLCAAHLVLLLTAPLELPMGGRYAVAAVLGGVAVLGLVNCVHYMQGRSRARAGAHTLIFVFGILAFYVTMLSLLEVALG